MDDQFFSACLIVAGVVGYLYGLWEGLREGKAMTIKALTPKEPPAPRPVTGPIYPDASSNHKTKRMRK